MIARLAASVLIVVAAFCGPGASAQEIRIERVAMQAPVGGASAAAPAGFAFTGSAALSFGAPVALAPSIGLSIAAPSASTPGAALGPAPALEASAAPAAAGVSRFPAAEAAAAPASPSAYPSMGLELHASGAATALPSRVLPAPGALRRAAQALDSVPLAAADGPRTSESDRDGAQRDFSALLGERLVESAAAPADEPAAAPGAAPLLSPSRPGGRFFAAVPVAAVPVAAAAGLALHPSAATWHALSVGGYVAGNVGAAIFPLVQIYQTFHGKSTPRSRAIIGALASLALGLICAPILHKTLWGVQNIFGGLTLLVPLLLGALKGRVRGSGLKETALISAAALAVSAAVYFAAAAAVPALLSAAFSAAVIAKIVLAVQFATSAMFLWMFLPDVVKVLRGKAAGGFSPGFNLMFFLSAVGSALWAVPSAWIYSGADQNTYRLIFAVNAIYALASFVSYWFARRETKPS